MRRRRSRCSMEGSSRWVRLTRCALAVGTSTRVIEARGRTVVPGLIDTHVHALGVAAAETTRPFHNLSSIGELQDVDSRRGPAGAAGHLDMDAACVPDAPARAPFPDSSGA